MAARWRRGRGRGLGLGIYLIRPVPGVTVGAQAEGIGGSYTDVSWDIGVWIAADGTLHLVSQGRKRRKIERNRCGPARETYRLLHHACSDAGREPGHLAKITRPATRPRSAVGKTGPGLVPKRR